MTALKLGFIGSGKCGMSLARYFKVKGHKITGFASRHPLPESGFAFFSKDEILKQSDIIFITVSDSAIACVWNEIKACDLSGKIICHCSGSMTSEIFNGADADMVCSVHPMLAFNSRQTDIKAIENAFFTLEGGKSAVDALSRLLNGCGNRCKVIAAEHKAEYHAAACFASNFVVAVCEKAEQHLSGCGFSREEAHTALIPLMRNNMENIIRCGTKGAATGPAARRDTETIEKHRAVLGSDRVLYDLLTDIITDLTR